MSPSVVTVDGPAASGKSTAARGVAESLGFRHLNSGVLYRAVGWAALEEGWADMDGRGIADRVDALQLELVPAGVEYRVRIGQREPGTALRSPRVAEAASRLSRFAPVRTRVNGVVRAAGARADLVCDGRDAGTVIFPDAELKVFLTADPEERAKRRLLEEGEEAGGERLRLAVERIEARDEADASRELDPLRRADDALEIDTTDLEPAEVVDRIVAEARRRGLGYDASGRHSGPAEG